MDQAHPEDYDLIRRFEKTLASLNPDMTIFYQSLIDLPQNIENGPEITRHFQDSFYKIPGEEKSEDLIQLIHSYIARIKANTYTREESSKIMKENNPRFIPRNYLLHQAIEELERGEETLFLKLQEAIRVPYSKNADEFFIKRPGWASHKAGCSMLSCSS